MFGGNRGPGPMMRQIDHSSSRKIFSTKVFIGGIPPGTDPSQIKSCLAMFDAVEIQWTDQTPVPMGGYVFAIFNHREAVNALANACRRGPDSRFEFYMPSLSKVVHVRPFCLNDANYILDENWPKYIRYSVFVGALPRFVTAQSLAVELSNIFGPIVHCSIELDFFNSYPKGAARVVFREADSYTRAAATGHTMIRISEAYHRVEMKTFLFNGMPCEMCPRNTICILSDSFCGSCLKYYCKRCWDLAHQYFASGHERVKETRRELPSQCRQNTSFAPQRAPFRPRPENFHDSY